MQFTSSIIKDEFRCRKGATLKKSFRRFHPRLKAGISTPKTLVNLDCNPEGLF